MLRAADASVKLAIVMKKLNVSAADARAALEKEGGVIRRVVKGAPPPVEPA